MTEILGKDGFVKINDTQKHEPSDDLIFININDIGYLLTQKNHPIIVYNSMGENQKVISAGDISTDDYIYINNDVIMEFDNNIMDVIDHNIKSDSSYGTFSTEYCIGQFTEFDFRIKYDIFNSLTKEDMLYILETLISNSDTSFYSDSFYLPVYSFTFFQQIKVMCDYCGIANYVIYDTNNNYPVFNIVISADDFLHFKHNDVSYPIIHTGYYQVLHWFDVDKNSIKYVYDIKTETEEFLNNSVQTHNSFHCIHGQMNLYIKDNDVYRLTSFEKLWNDTTSNIILNGDQEEKFINNVYVWDHDKYTEVEKIIRHKKNPDSEMVMMRSNNGDFIISQDNHPHMLALNTELCPTCNTPYSKTRKNGHWKCLTCGFKPKSVKHASDGVYNPIESKQFIKSKFFSKNSFPIWQTDIKYPMMDAYLLGFFLAEGSYVKYPTGLRGLKISQTKGTKEYNYVLNELENTYKYDVRTSGNMCIRIYEKELANTIFNSCGEYSYGKSLPYDFVYYTDENLSKILCGFIDGDGAFITPKVGNSYISIECTALEIIQQLHHILSKFDINHKINVSQVRHNTKYQAYKILIYPSKNDVNVFKYSLKVDLNKLPEKYECERYNSLVTYCHPVLFNKNSYVYDLVTKSHTLTVNGFYTHNTGGVAEFKNINVLDELSQMIDDKYKSVIKDTFIQKENAVYSNMNNLFLQINTNIFKEKGVKIENNENDIMLPLGYIKFILKDLIIPLYLEDEITISKNDTYNIENGIINIVYNINDLIFKVNIKAQDPAKVAQSLDSLIGGKSPFEDPTTLLLKFYKTLMQFGNFDLVHLEIILSNILRNKNKPEYPARIIEPYEYRTISIKNLPMVLSPVLGLCFENISKSLTFALTSDHQPEPSSIEKVLLGEPLSDLSNKIKKKKF